MNRAVTFSLEENWQSFLETLPGCLALTDTDDRIAFANRQLHELLGYTDGTLKGMRLSELRAGCDLCVASNQITDNSNCAASDGKTSYETCLIQKNGVHIEVLVNSAPFTFSAGLYCLTSINDISALKTAQQMRLDETLLYQTLFNSINEAVFLAPISDDGTHGNFVEVNDYACQYLGYSRDELLQMNARTINPTANLTKVKSFGNELINDGKKLLEAIHVAKDGTQIPVEVMARIVTLHGQNHVLSVARDMRERKALQRTQTWFGYLLDHSWDEILVIDSNSLQIIQANQGATTNLGYSLAELQHINLVQLNANLSRSEFNHLIEPLTNGELSRVVYESMHRRKDGSTYPVEVRLQISHSDVPAVFLANIQDITDRKKNEAKLHYMANHDALTGLPNRSLFIDRLEHTLQQVTRYHHQAALIFLDLDGFKNINDSLGHDYGDRLIKIIAERLTTCIRRSDTIARLGGDEFTFILSKVKDPGDIEDVAQRIVQSIAAPVPLANKMVRTSASVGVVCITSDMNTNAQELMKDADAAMYHAKELGKNRYVFFSSELAHINNRRSKIVNALQTALQNNEFSLYYQPKFNLSDQNLSGCEALLRWNHPELGSIPPSEFIPPLEASGLIKEIGTWVLRQACQQLKKWHKTHPLLRLSVNVSAVQFENEDIYHEVFSILNQLKIPADTLELEITESTLISQSAHTKKTLDRLKKLGIIISLDDFGAGYSSMNYLLEYPIDIIKIDSSFIRELTRNRKNAVIVDAIIHIAKGMNLSVTAEGIEVSEQLEHLKQSSCEEGQGFLFSKPIDADEFQNQFLQR